MEIIEKDGKIFVLLAKEEFKEIVGPYLRDGSAKMIALEQIKREYEQKLRNLGVT